MDSQRCEQTRIYGVTNFPPSNTVKLENVDVLGTFRNIKDYLVTIRNQIKTACMRSTQTLLLVTLLLDTLLLGTLAARFVLVKNRAC